MTFSGSEKGVSNVVIKAMDEFPERKHLLDHSYLNGTLHVLTVKTFAF